MRSLVSVNKFGCGWGSRCVGEKKTYVGVSLLGLATGEMASVEQFVSQVANFSSQYGTAGTSSYTASNLVSGLNVYPKYGDYTEAFVLVSSHLYH